MYKSRRRHLPIYLEICLSKFDNITYHDLIHSANLQNDKISLSQQQCWFTHTHTHTYAHMHAHTNAPTHAHIHPHMYVCMHSATPVAPLLW